MKRQSIRIKTQNDLIREQERKLQEQQTKLHEQESTVADLKKHMDEWEQKYSDLTAELVRAREDRTKPLPSPKESTPVALPNSIYKTNIKPRASFSFSAPFQFHTELERKRKASISNEIPSKLSRSYRSNEEITNIINENITNNISKSITDKYDNDGKIKNEKINPQAKKSEFSSFISSSIETLLKNPITSIQSRKRKYARLST